MPTRRVADPADTIARVTDELKKSRAEKRDIELENIVGNLLIAEFQVDKLRGRLMEKITPAYSGQGAVNTSSYTFKVGSRWYKLNLSVEEQPELSPVKE